MTENRIVLDTNCLISSLSLEGGYHEIWTGMVNGSYNLCYSNDILLEYEEIVAYLTTSEIAKNVVRAIEQSPYTIKIDPYFHFEIITSDPDDNKFVDCAIAGNAAYIVSEDKHFKVIESVQFPRLNLLNINQFIEKLKGWNE